LLVVLEVLSFRSFEDHGMMEEAGVIEKQPKTPQTFANSLNISLVSGCGPESLEERPGSAEIERGEPIY